MKTTTYGKRLQQLRLSAGMSQSQLATKVGVSKFTLQSHEQNRRMFDADFLMAYSKALGVKCDAFAGCITIDMARTAKKLGIKPHCHPSGS